MKTIEQVSRQRPGAQIPVQSSPRRNRLLSSSARKKGYLRTIGFLAPFACYGMGHDARMNAEVYTPTPDVPRSVSVLQSPPSSERVPKVVGRISVGAEIICAHYAFELFPSPRETAGFKAADYRVFKMGSSIGGYVGAEDLLPDRPVPPCNENPPFRKELLDSVPGIEYATSPVHGTVIE